MRLGVFYFNPDYGIDIGELARALEDWAAKEGLLAAIFIDFLRRAERR